MFSFGAYMAGDAMGRGASLDKAAIAELAERKAKANADLGGTLEALRNGKDKLARLEKYEENIAKLRGVMQKCQEEVDKLEPKLASKKADLAQITAEVKAMDGRAEVLRRSPVELPAGQFVVGRDIRPGRYAVVGESNFIVNGGQKVNTILGRGGVDQYVCDLEDGDQIQIEGADRFYPID